MKVLNSAFETIIKTSLGKKDFKTHIVCAGCYYRWDKERFESMILETMKKYKIKKVMVTTVFMLSYSHIVKKEMEEYCFGKKGQKQSINDDLESLFQDILLGKNPDDEVDSYFLPMLPEHLLEDYRKRNCDHQYRHHFCSRRTFTIEDI